MDTTVVENGFTDEAKQDIQHKTDDEKVEKTSNGGAPAETEQEGQKTDEEKLATETGDAGPTEEPIMNGDDVQENPESSLVIVTTDAPEPNTEPAEEEDKRDVPDGSDTKSPVPAYTPPETEDGESITSVDEAQHEDNGPATDDQHPGTDDQQPATDEDVPTADDQGPASDDQALETDDQAPATDDLPKDKDDDDNDTEHAITAALVTKELIDMADREDQGSPNQEPEKPAETTNPEEGKSGETANQEPETESTDSPKDEKADTEAKEDKKTDDAEHKPDEAKVVVAAAGTAIAAEQLAEKIRQNEELERKLESTLSNQNAEKEAFQKLTDENAKLQKQCDDAMQKLEEVEGGHVLMAAEVETLKKVNKEQEEEIASLRKEIDVLKSSQGDDAVKGLQDQLIRLAKEQEDKDKRIHSLEAELENSKEKQKEAETQAARNGGAQADGPKSKTCAIM